MRVLTTAILSAAALTSGVVAKAQVIADNLGYPSESSMGPVAFLWPSDRPWSAAKDNTAPCGSSQSEPFNRTYFPMTDGSVAIVAKDDAWNITVKIAYTSNPTAESDFQTTLVETKTSEEDPGHVCYAVPDAPSSVTSGTNATLQLTYVAVDGNKNDSFYACADIQYITEQLFNYQIPCFNAMVDDSSSSSGSSSSSSSAASSGHNVGATVATVAALVGLFAATMW